MKNGIDSLTLKMLDTISEITMTKYDYDNIDELYSMLGDLLREYENLKDEFEDYQIKINEEYELKKINPYEEYGISESDFH